MLTHPANALPKINTSTLGAAEQIILPICRPKSAISAHNQNDRICETATHLEQGNCDHESPFGVCDDDDLTICED